MKKKTEPVKRRSKMPIDTKAPIRTELMSGFPVEMEVEEKV